MTTIRPEVEEKVRQIMSKIMRKKDIKFTQEDTFKGMGADSLDIVQVLVGVEEAFGIELVDDELKELNNLNQFLEYIQKKIDEKK